MIPKNESKLLWILLYRFCNPKMVFRVKLVRWLLFSTGAAFSGCETHPIPINFTKRFIWYISRVLGLVRIYKMMIDHYESNERVKGKGKSP
jgi:hypothetical protein